MKGQVGNRKTSHHEEMMVIRPGGEKGPDSDITKR